MNQQVILIGTNGLGKGDDTLGGLIMANFLRLLGERPDKPTHLICWNTGVRLMAEGSIVLDHLRALEKAGVKILACRTCCEFLGIEEQIVVGEITGMAQIQEILFSSTVLTV